MQIVTRLSDPTHRIAFGTRDTADQFIAGASDPADWTLEELDVGDVLPTERVVGGTAGPGL